MKKEELNTLRITDPDPEGSSNYKPQSQPSGNDIMSRLKPSSTVTSINEKILINKKLPFL